MSPIRLCRSSEPRSLTRSPLCQQAIDPDKNVTSHRTRTEVRGCSVPFPIAGRLCAPILLIRLWPLAPRFAVMPVPEAAVNENDLASLREHQVGIPRQVFAVQTITIPQTVHESAHPHLRLRILTVHLSHCAFTLRRGEIVSIDQTHCRSITWRAPTVKQFSPRDKAISPRGRIGYKEGAGRPVGCASCWVGGRRDGANQCATSQEGRGAGGRHRWRGSAAGSG